LTNLDSEQYKETERQSWNNAAVGWQKWWKTIERGTKKVSRELIALAEIKPSSRVLDIATGIGEPAITAANQIDSSGHILAIDISPKMLSIAKQRAISLGLQNVIEFKEGDMETIDLSSTTFDAVLCRFGLMFLPELKVGLSKIYQSLIEGGHFAAAVWASPSQDNLIAKTMNIIMKETNSKPPPPGTPGPFSLSDENSLRNSFVISGFKDLTIERMGVMFDFNSPDDYTSWASETAGPLLKMLATQTSERKKEILQAVTEEAKKYVYNNAGGVRFKIEAILISGKK
jgi:ubiquinone/menaquinone biosynthesis C-methylase UbiE